MTEFEVRLLDEHGDAQDIAYHATASEALIEAKEDLAGGAVAVVVERHISYHPAFMFDIPNVRKMIARMGSRAALAAGDWHRLTDVEIVP